MPEPWWLLLVLFALSSALVVPSKVVATDTNVKRGATLTKFETFAFEGGGTVSISAREKPSDSSFKIFIAEQATANRVIKYASYSRFYSLPRAGSWFQFCHAPVNPGTLWIFPLSTQDTKIQIRTEQNYFFFLLDCATNGERREIDLRYVLLRDSDGGQLSLGEVFVPFFQFAFLGLWLFVLSGWLFLNALFNYFSVVARLDQRLGIRRPDPLFLGLHSFLETICLYI